MTHRLWLLLLVAPVGAPGDATRDEPAAQRRESPLNAAARHLANDDPAQALQSLGLLEQAEPTNPWLWYLRGLSQVRLHRTHVGLASLEKAAEFLASSGADDAVLARSIAMARRDARRRLFSLRWEIGFAYDTNVDFIGDAATGIGLVGGEEDFKVVHRFDVNGIIHEDDDNTISYHAGTTQIWHDDVTDFDYQAYGGGFEFVRRLAPTWEFELGVDSTHNLLGTDAFSSIQSATLSITKEWEKLNGHASWTSVYYILQHRDFHFRTTPSFDRDGVANFGGIAHAFSVQPVSGFPWVWDIMASYRLGDYSTEGTEFDRREHRFTLSVSCPLLDPSNPSEYLFIPDLPAVLRFDAEWVIDRYRQPSQLDVAGRRREDLLRTFGFTLSQTLFDDPRKGTLDLRGLVSFGDANSNVRAGDDRTAPFTYDKNVYGLQLHWQW